MSIHMINLDKENIPPVHQKELKPSRKRVNEPRSAIGWGPPRKQNRQDPLVGHGRHFGRTIHTFCRMHTLIRNGLSTSMQIELGRMSEYDLSPRPVPILDSLSTRMNQLTSPWKSSDLLEYKLYHSLLALSPGLEERLNTGTEQDMTYIADMLTKGISSARSDDTKSLKSAVIDWITPRNGVLRPPIQRNVKTDRGFHHERTGQLLCPVQFNWSDEMTRRDLASGQLVPSGDMWPRFLFQHYEYNPTNPWEGLFRSSLLVMAYKHVFTSPSSVYTFPGKATRSSNARIHGMTEVTAASLAYIATQVRFSLCSSPVFSRTDLMTDSEFFYNLIIDLLEDEAERSEVADLLKWWNLQIFPAQVTHTRLVHGDSVIAKIKERRRLINEGKHTDSVLGERGEVVGENEVVNDDNDSEVAEE